MISTRDTNSKGRSYSDVLLEGLAEDGGLYVPNEYPRFSSEELRRLKGISYAKLAFAIKKKLIDGAIPEHIEETLIDEAYKAPTFGNESDAITPLRTVGPNLYIQNLSLGPTASFKDMAMQLLSREMGFELSRRGESLTILGATSGDTGSAAEAAFKNIPGIRLFMLSPQVGMSEFQRAQMGALSGGNICNISIRGRFDDCQDLVKAVKQSDEFSKLGAVNSINWGRISSQIPYYFAGYLQAVSRIGEPVDFVVPSGNFGNVLSGYIAKQMGLPIRKCIVATNENNVLDILFKTGVYAVKTAHITSSPSMDISKASNYERLVFDLFEHDASKTRTYMETFGKTGRVDLGDFGKRPENFLQLGFESDNSSHSERIATIQEVYITAKTVIDPHTADGVRVALKRTRDVPTICLETALPVKFEQTIREALGFVPERPPRFLNMEKTASEESFIVLDPEPEALKTVLRAH
ncbi:MAG: hypothetical protein RIQ56_386 [Candidatus Parcubacteria bacterium]